MGPKRKTTKKKGSPVKKKATKKAAIVPEANEEDGTTVTAASETAQRKEPPPTPPTPSKRAAASSPEPAATQDDSVASHAPVAAVQVPQGANVSQAGSGGHEHDELTLGASTAARTFKGLLQSNQHDALRCTVRTYVGKHFFPRVKFITKASKLFFYPVDTHPNSYCAIITRGCNLHHTCSMDPASWWELIAKKEVKRKICQLRSDRLTALKWMYYGKWSAVRFN